MGDDTVIGRKYETAFISGCLDKRRSLIVFGDEGVGKSTVVREIARAHAHKDTIYVRDNGTLRQTLTGILSASSRETDKSIYALSIPALKKRCYEIIKGLQGHIIFDHLGRVEPKQCAFFTYLIEKNTPLVFISRGLHKKDIGHLRLVLYDFEKIEIKNLHKTDSYALTGCFMKEFGVQVTKDAEFKRAVFTCSKGNPKKIRALCFLARDGQYRKNDTIDVQLMDLDRRISEAVR